MMRPPLGFCTVNILNASRVQRKAPVTLVERTEVKLVRERSERGVAGAVMPAFWMYAVEICDGGLTE
jgi:hypothetical protein